MNRYSRRSFIRKSIGFGAGVLALPSCRSIDRMIMGEDISENNLVIILGAGLAGLVAARQLKAQGIPYRVYEASRRPGGRVWTLYDFNVSDQFGEIGGEWIYSHQTSILRLCNELNIKLVEEARPRFLNWSFCREGAVLSTRDVQLIGKDFSEMIKSVPFRALAEGSPLSYYNRSELIQANEIDKMSASAWLAKSKVRNETLNSLIERWIEFEFGCEANDLSALSFLYSLPRKGFYGLWNKSAVYRLSGGAQLLAQTLYDDVAGIIPDRLVKLNHELIKLNETDNQIELTFKTPSGNSRVSAKKIICTLPLSVLREIDGIGKLSFERNVHDAIFNFGVGTATKGLVSFAEKLLPVPRVNDFLVQSKGEMGTAWKSQPMKEGEIETTPANIMTFQIGGRAGLQAGPQWLDQCEKEIVAIAGKPHVKATESQLHNWSRYKWAKGSRSFMRPGQNGSYGGLFLDSHCKDKWYFAGEHCSLRDQGSMNGAVESGLWAVGSLKEKIKT